jgi:hypothetical protein
MKPTKYDVTVIVTPSGSREVELKAEMQNIERSDIMAPDYPSPAVRLLVEQIERFYDFGSPDRENEAL